MSAIWDGDTGHVTITATKDGAPVNLTGATVTVISRTAEAPFVALELAEVEASSDRAGGIIVADAGPLEVGTYNLVMRVEAGGIRATYPTADKGAETLRVDADLDAV